MQNDPAFEFGMTRTSLEGLVEQALADAAGQGADQVETAASLGTGLSVMVRRGEVETLEYQRDRGFTVTVYFGPRKGSASTSDLASQAIRETVAKACSIARFTAEDQLSGLADPDLMPTEVPDLALDHPWALSPEEAIRIATECEAAGLDFDPRITNSEGGTLNSHRGLRVYGNSHGFVGGYASSSHGVSCVLVAAAEDGSMERDYWYTASRDPSTLEPIDDVGQRAAQRAVARLGARKLSTRDAPVLFPAELARGLIGHFVSAIGGTSQYRRASFLLDAVGEQIFPSGFRIDERPHLPAAMASVPFDAEGVATRDRVLVEDGKLESYVLSSYSARRLGLKSTGNAGGIHNLIVGPGQGSLADLMAEMGSGFLVSELIGQGVNTVTGDYSRGAAGFWVENGEIQFPVSEITIAGNLRSMLTSIARIGGDIDARGAVHTGSILIEKMKIAGD